jgi:hypothetical protein
LAHFPEPLDSECKSRDDVDDIGCNKNKEKYGEDLDPEKAKGT